MSDIKTVLQEPITPGDLLLTKENVLAFAAIDEIGLKFMPFEESADAIRGHVQFAKHATLESTLWIKIKTQSISFKTICRTPTFNILQGTKSNGYEQFMFIEAFDGSIFMACNSQRQNTTEKWWQKFQQAPVVNLSVTTPVEKNEITPGDLLLTTSNCLVYAKQDDIGLQFVPFLNPDNPIHTDIKYMKHVSLESSFWESEPAYLRYKEVAMVGSLDVVRPLHYSNRHRIYHSGRIFIPEFDDEKWWEKMLKTPTVEGCYKQPVSKTVKTVKSETAKTIAAEPKLKAKNGLTESEIEAASSAQRNFEAVKGKDCFVEVMIHTAKLKVQARIRPVHFLDCMKTFHKIWTLAPEEDKPESKKYRVSMEAEECNICFYCCKQK